jgi:lysophospholipase L1-like esterase
VEYFSRAQGKWVQAKVLTVNPQGTYDLDCKSDVLPGIMRTQGPTIDYTPDSWAGQRCKHDIRSDNPECTPETETFAVLKFLVGEAVEYSSSTHDRWINAKVLSINPHGTYNLDCKAVVRSDRMRKCQNGLTSRSEREATVCRVPESSILHEVTEVRLPQNNVVPDVPLQQTRIPGTDSLDAGRVSRSGTFVESAAEADWKYFGAKSFEPPSKNSHGFLPSTLLSIGGLWMSPSITDRPLQTTRYHEQEQCAVLCFGDSLTQGFCFTKGQIVPYTDRLAQRLSKRVAVVNGGMSGHTTRDMLARLPKLLEAGHCSGSHGTAKPFSFVVILGGTNDLNQASAEKEAIVRNVCALHREVHRHNPNARTAVVTLPFLRAQSTQRKVEADRHWINASLREFAESDPHRRLLIDLAAAIPQDDAHAELWDPDGVHFSPAGYRVMGDVIGDAMCAFDRALCNKAPLDSGPFDWKSS